MLGSGVATEVWAAQGSQKWAGYFNAGGEAREGHTPEEVEQGIYAEIEKLQRDEVPAEELQKVKNNFAAGEYRRLSSNMAILMHLVHNEGMGRLARDQRRRPEGSGRHRRRCEARGESILHQGKSRRGDLHAQTRCRQERKRKSKMKCFAKRVQFDGGRCQV